MWSGSISFGLVNIPVNLYTASQERELNFHLLHKQDRSPIRFARICRTEGVEIPNEDIVRGYEYKKDQYVLLDDEDFKRANMRKSKSIEIFEFVDEKEIDPMYFEKPYFIEPQQSGKAYGILHEALKRTKKVGLAKIVLLHKEQLGIVRAAGDMLMLVIVRFPEELRKPTGLDIPKKEAWTDKEVRVAMQIIEKQSDRFHPGRYHDEYSKELRALIQKKAKGKRVTVKGKAPVATKASDLMAELERSLRRAPPRPSRSRAKQRQR